jgi:DNA-directed RNA polymerase III subunit RPC8
VHMSVRHFADVPGTHRSRDRASQRPWWVALCSVAEATFLTLSVEFRMVVFRPFRGEILYGRIKSSNEEGIVIDVEFHNEIFVPYQNLFSNCKFDQSERTWIWKAEGGAELFFDQGEPVLFRVEQEEWFDQKPSVQLKDGQGNLIIEHNTAWRVIVRHSF